MDFPTGKIAGDGPHPAQCRFFCSARFRRVLGHHVRAAMDLLGKDRAHRADDQPATPRRAFLVLAPSRVSDRCRDLGTIGMPSSGLSALMRTSAPIPGISLETFNMYGLP